MRNSIIKVFLIFVIFGVIIAFRLFIFDIYKIPSGSMEPTLISGDYVVINRIIYGPRIMNIGKLIFSREMKYSWLKGPEEVRKNDIIVFNYPQYEYLADSVDFIYGTVLIKRCLGIPGDGIRIRKNGSEINKSGNSNSNLFPYDTALHWSLDYYGPLYVPRRGDTMVYGW